MTRKSLIARENKRMKTVAKYATKRAELKKTFLDMSKTDEERFEAIESYRSFLEMQVHQEFKEDVQ